MLRDSPRGVSHWDFMTLKQKEQVTFWIYSKTSQGTHTVHSADPTPSYRASSSLTGEYDTRSASLIGSCGWNVCASKTVKCYRNVKWWSVLIQPYILTLGSIFMPRCIEQEGKKCGKVLAYCFSKALAWSLTSRLCGGGGYSVWKRYSV